MKTGSSQRKYGSLFAILVVIIMVVVCTVLFLLYAPEHILSFAIVPLVPLSLIIFLVLHRRSRLRFHKLLTKYQTYLQAKKDTLYRYGRLLNALTITILLTFSLLIYYNSNLLDIAYVPYLFLVIFIAFIVSAIIFIASMVKLGGKWALLLIMILVAIVTLRILLYKL